MRDQPPFPPDDPEDEQHPAGTLRPVSPAALAVWAIVGLVAGWLAHPLSERVNGVAFQVTWLPALALVFVAALLFAVGWSTSRAMRGQRERPAPHQMVNRFVAGRASALAGSLVAGAYVGYALSWIGVAAEGGPDRMIHAGAAAVAAVAMTVAGVLLERACRTGSGDRGA
ncbi:MAG: DUF3180 domain-containing protein [Nocardioidaceae bacterium]